MSWTHTDITHVPRRTRKHSFWVGVMVGTCVRCGVATRRHLHNKSAASALAGKFYCSKVCAGRSRVDRPVLPEGQRQCRACQGIFGVATFTKDSGEIDGLSRTCKPCLYASSAASSKRSREARIRANECTVCKVRIEPGSNRVCRPCGDARNQANTALRTRRRAKSECIRCAAPSLAGDQCMRCWFRATATAACQRTDAEQKVVAGIIESLWRAQGCRCALTGAELTPGAKSASLDHIIPVARGGRSDAENLRWVSLPVNVAKSALSDEDFVAMCRAVVKHHDMFREDHQSNGQEPDGRRNLH